MFQMGPRLMSFPSPFLPFHHLDSQKPPSVGAPRWHCPGQVGSRVIRDRPSPCLSPCQADCKRKEKKKPNSLLLFPVKKKIHKERFGRFMGSCETACLARSHLGGNLHVPGCHPRLRLTGPAGAYQERTPLAGSFLLMLESESRGLERGCSHPQLS